MNNAEKNVYVKRQITEKLIEMLKTKSVSEISVCSLTKQAAVGRASFYRNFADKEDVLKQESERLIRKWSHEFESDPYSTKDTIFVSLIDFYRKHSEFYTTLYKANMSYIMLDTIIAKVGISEDMPNVQAYLNSFLAYGIYGWIVEWLKRGMLETGEELHTLFQSIESPFNQ